MSEMELLEMRQAGQLAASRGAHAPEYLNAQTPEATRAWMEGWVFETKEILRRRQEILSRASVIKHDHDV